MDPASQGHFSEDVGPVALDDIVCFLYTSMSFVCFVVVSID